MSSPPIRSTPVSAQRLTAADRVRREIDGLFADPDREVGDLLEQVAPLSVRLVRQSALESLVISGWVRGLSGRPRHTTLNAPADEPEDPSVSHAESDVDGLLVCAIVSQHQSWR